MSALSVKTKSIVSQKETHFFMEIITYDSSLNIIDHPDFIVRRFLENSIGPKRLKIVYSLNLVITETVSTLVDIDHLFQPEQGYNIPWIKNIVASD